MIIRCERCSTLYELDEGLLAPEGSQVQCAKCQAIFLARPPMAAAPVEPVPAPPAPSAVEPAVASVAPSAASALHAEPLRSQAPPAEASAHAPTAETPPRAPEASPPAAEPASSDQAAPQGTADRPARSAPQRPTRPGPAVYRAQPAAPRPTSGKPNARTQRRSALRPGPPPETRRPYALIAFVVAAVALLATGVWTLWRNKPDAEASRLAVEASARVALDDAASLARGVQLYDELLARSPGQVEAEVERAVARLLMAAGQQEEAEPLADQLATLQVDRSRLDSERPAGSEELLRDLAAEAARLEAELDPRRKAAEALLSQASAELRTLASGPSREGLAARGQVLQAALAGDRSEVDRLLPLARGAGPSPWPALAQAWIELRGSGSRELAMSRLAELVKARPEVLRARYLLARVQAQAGRHEEALSTLAGLLAANPRHERALKLQAQLTSAAVRPAQEGVGGAATATPSTTASPRAPNAGPTTAPPAGQAATPPGQAAPAQAAPPAQPQPTPPTAGAPQSVQRPASPPPGRPPAAPPTQPAPQPAAPRPAATAPRTAAPAPAPGQAAVAPPVHGEGGPPVMLPAPTRIEVARPAVKAANIDAGTVTPLAPEPAPSAPARP